MANIQVKNVPDWLHERLREAARMQHRTLSDLILEALEREVAHLDFQRNLASRSEVDLGTTAALLLREVRAERDQELG